MITRNDLRTTSYGHVLARQLRAAVGRIPPEDRERVLDKIGVMAGASDLIGAKYNDKVLGYAASLLRGQKPKTPLGKNRKEERKGNG